MTTGQDTLRPKISRRPRSGKPSQGSRRSALDGWAFLAPFMLVYLAFIIFPLFQSVYVSGFNWDLLGATRKFIGGGNYVKMLWGRDIIWGLGHEWAVRLTVVAVTVAFAFTLRRKRRMAIGILAAGLVIAVLLGLHPAPTGSWNDENFWIALKNTLGFTLISTPVLVLTGLVLALLLHTKRRGTGIYRALFFIPYVLPVSAVTLIWSYLLNPERGLIAGFLRWFGIDGIPFLSDPALAMPSIIATTVWWSAGFNLVLFLAGLQDIDPSLNEAASLDGANRWQLFRHITVPGLSHVTVLVAVTQLIASFQIFGQVYIMTKGGPGTATQVLIQHIYEAGFKNYELGYASAVSVFLFVIMAAVSAVQFRLLSKDS
ncbi:MAG: sugar ABC transporter permease [Actinomycetota bacterium]|nr:sugar ABC transporter permease [Actinomycetota bacterium]